MTHYEMTDEKIRYFKFSMDGESFEWEIEELADDLMEILEKNPTDGPRVDQPYLKAIVEYIKAKTGKEIKRSQARDLEGAIHEAHTKFKKKAVSGLMSLLNTESPQANLQKTMFTSSVPTANGTGQKQNSDTGDGTAS